MEGGTEFDLKVLDEKSPSTETAREVDGQAEEASTR